jgi:hypothetical protein
MIAATPPPRPVVPAFDRETERRDVLRVVLESVFGRDRYGKSAQRYVVDPTLRSGGAVEVRMDDREVERLRAAGFEFPEPLRLPDGSRVFAPQLEGLDPVTTADWTTHALDSPAPRNLVADRPIEWFTSADWDTLAVHLGEDRIDIDGSWDAFHRKFPGSCGHVHSSDVGFSARHDQALVQAWSLAGGEDGAGYWILLEKRDGRWTVVEQQQEWVS